MTRISKNGNCFNFWKQKASTYPILAQVARKFLGIPVTSTPIECVFSHGENILCPDRSCLRPKNFEQLLFLKVNSVYCK